MLAMRFSSSFAYSLMVATTAAFATVETAQAKLDLFGDLPIVEAIKDGSIDAAKTAIIDGASVHSRAADGTPVIVLAVSERHLDIVKLLIENGARPDDRSKKDETSPLTLASANGDLEIVTYLLEHKADVDLPGALRETALIKAARAHNNDVVKVLLVHGANTEDTDTSGATALDIAERAGWKDLADLLKTKKAVKK